MSPVRLAIVGAGSVRCAIPVIGTLATWFGDRPLEIVMYDADEVRLDLFDLFARFCFLATRSTHQVKATTHLAEALDGSDKVLIQVDDNCARKMLGRSEGMVLDEALEQVYARVPAHAEVMSLMLNRDLPLDEYRAMDWPGPLSEEDWLGIPFQVLRYLHQEEYLYDVLKEGKMSPLRPWLELPVRQVPD
jgi:hypothetical protein